MNASRQQKAAKITAILTDYLGKPPHQMQCLDVGCGDGSMLAHFATHFNFIVGIDTQAKTQSELKIQASGENIPFPDQAFDVVICAQVYEHAQNPSQLANEIRRVLKPAGLVFFSGPNRYALIEEHYHLPLLSWLPPALADKYLQWTRRGTQYLIRPLRYPQLRHLWQAFEIVDYTPKLLHNPAQYHVDDRVRVKIPLWLGRLLRRWVPNFNWILRPRATPTPQPSDYTQDYYLSECDGHQEFIQSRGKELPQRLAYPLKLARLQRGQRALDLGCGRGELALHCARRGALTWGLDYAPAALALTRQLPINPRLVFQQASARKLPFAAGSFDRVFMLDVVEHLTPRQLDAVLQEIWRVLKPGGALIIHTMPNLWYYRCGYPLYRWVQKLRGVRLPRDPRARWAYAHLHVNEQHPHQLRGTLRAHGYHPRVWLANVQTFAHEPNPGMRALQTLLTRLPIVKNIFCNDIFAFARKPPLR